MFLGGNAGFALLAALLWGGGDFSGGMSVGAAGGRSAGALRMVMLSHATSLGVLLVIVAVTGEGWPRGAGVGWGLLAGLCAAISLTSFYIALSRGAMGVSAAVSGLLAAAIPAATSMVIEGRPSALRLAGFAVAAVAIWMIAAGSAAAPEAEAGKAEAREFPGTLTLAVIAGVGFGVYFTALRFANGLGLVMPMALARVGSLATCAVMLLALLSRGAAGGAMVTRAGVLWALGAGALDTTGNILFIAATRAGRLDVAAVLASLYPASTIVLARFVLHERMAARQLAGMAVAVAAVVMITV